MPATGLVSARYGGRPASVAGGIGIALTLPALALAGTPLTLALALFLFGASLGTIDVAMNVHAVDVERDAGRPMMSGFHALFSVGGFAGAGVMTFLLSAGLRPVIAALLCAALVGCTILIARPFFLDRSGVRPERLLVWPRGIVLLLAGLACIGFLAEGALLDWSALLIVGAGIVPSARGGLGYMIFSVAMTIGRLSGDAIIRRFGNRLVLQIGGAAAVAGFLMLIAAKSILVAAPALLLIGFGASNVVPILFSRVGSQTVMPAGLAVAALTTLGYGGILVGPAAIGFIANGLGLKSAFVLLALLLCLVPLSAPWAAGRRA
jgi:predicted MFS family arabinose efflux permease